MDRPLITIPAGFLRHLDCTWDIDWRGQSAGAFNDGVTKTAYTGFPRWVGSPGVSLYRDEISTWRAIMAHAQGRRGIYRVRMIDTAAFRLTDTGATESEINIGKPSAEGNLFTNGAGWEYEPFVTAAADAAKGATTIRVDVSASGGVVPAQGQIMSHDDWPFVVSYVLHVSGDVYELGVEMPLRAAITSGDVVLMRGVGRFEAAEAGMGRPDYGPARFSQPTLSFVEVLRR